MNTLPTVSEFYNRGTIYLEKKNYEKALQFLKKEEKTGSVCKELYLNLGTVYHAIGEYDKSYKYLNMANDRDVPYLDGRLGEYPWALGNLGLLAYTLGDDVASKAYCNRALALDPLHKMSIWNYSLAMLREYCSGLPLHKWAWLMYEYRFKTIAGIYEGIPKWEPRTKVGTLLVLTEQGYGDKLMFSRYLNRLREYCDRLVVQCMDDMRGLYSDFETTNAVIDADASVALCNLAWIFGDEDNAEWLAGRFGKRGCEKKLRIAVEWSGNAGHLNDRNRSCGPGYFSKLIKKFPDVEFINIRPDSPKVKGVTKVAVKDWADSAREIANCDLVISVDTSIVHLAGSLGIECWMMQPLYNSDFRWGNPKTKVENGRDIESNIWYPSIKVLENPGWDKLMDEIILRLEIKRSEHNIKYMLGGNTVEQFVEKVKNAQNS